MKRALIILTAIIAFASCEKKSTNHTKSYFCVKNDSTFSNIPALNNPHYKDSAGYYNQYSDAQIAFFIKDFTRMDTLINTPDTLMLEFWTITCTEVER